MFKKALVASVALGLLIFPVIVSAQVNSDAVSAGARLKQQLAEIQRKKEANVNLGKQLKEIVKTRREEAKEAIEAKREEFRAQLKAIKDQRKKTIVEGIGEKLNNINIKHTSRYAVVLDNLQELLNRAKSSATNDSVLSDIASAQEAIDSAKRAVENQAAKAYSMTISSEISLRLDVGSFASQIRQDLTAAYKLVVDAKQAVQKIRGDNSLLRKDATGSANL